MNQFTFVCAVTGYFLVFEEGMKDNPVALWHSTNAQLPEPDESILPYPMEVILAKHVVTQVIAPLPPSPAVDLIVDLVRNGFHLTATRLTYPGTRQGLPVTPEALKHARQLLGENRHWREQSQEAARKWAVSQKPQKAKQPVTVGGGSSKQGSKSLEPKGFLPLSLEINNEALQCSKLLEPKDFSSLHLALAPFQLCPGLQCVTALVQQLVSVQDELGDEASLDCETFLKKVNVTSWFIPRKYLKSTVQESVLMVAESVTQTFRLADVLVDEYVAPQDAVNAGHVGFQKMKFNGALQKRHADNEIVVIGVHAHIVTQDDPSVSSEGLLIASIRNDPAYCVPPAAPPIAKALPAGWRPQGMERLSYAQRMAVDLLLIHQGDLKRDGSKHGICMHSAMKATRLSRHLCDRGLDFILTADPLWVIRAPAEMEEVCN